MRYFLLALALPVFTHAADQPTWGDPQTRNMISAEKNLPDTFDPATRKNVRWVAPLGTQTYSSPVIANGKVLIGTNNDAPRDATKTLDSGALYCLDEKTGALQWQLLAPKLEGDKYYDWPKTGMPSSATIDPALNRAYLLTNRVDVVCLDLNGLRDGNQGPFSDEAWAILPRTLAGEYTGQAKLTATDADILWSFDIRKTCDTWPHDGAHASPLIVGDHLYINTCNGVDNTHRKIRKPDAPSLIVLDKRTGKLLAQDNLKIGPNVFHSTWCSPAIVEIAGQKQILFGGGNGILYSFAPIVTDPKADASSLPVQTLKLLWSYDPDPTAPKTDVHQYSTNRKVSPSSLYAMPILAGGKLYLIPTGDWWWGKKSASLQCLDPVKLQQAGAQRPDEVRSAAPDEVRSAAPDEVRSAAPNAPAPRATPDPTKEALQDSSPEAPRPASPPNPALLWSYPIAAHCMTTPAISDDGLIFLADSSRLLHCIDSTTGKSLWTHKLLGEPWGSPVVADGKVYIGSRKGDFWILSASRELKILCHADLGSGVSSTVGIANGTIFIPTAKGLWAIGAVGNK